MTLISSFSGPAFSVMASDRLITLADKANHSYRGDYDKLSSKIIVYINEDFIGSIGYCGRAYIGGMTTDNWIVKNICPHSDLVNSRGAVGAFGFRTPSRIRLHQVCNRLRLGLAQVKGGDEVCILIVGWRIWRRKLIPVNLFVRSEEKLGPSIRMRMRPRWPLEYQFSHIGAGVSGAELFNALRSAEAGRSSFNEDFAREALINLTRIKSSNNPTVGKNVMCATMLHPSHKKVLISFDQAVMHYGQASFQEQYVSLPVVYSPWIITPGSFHAPVESSSSSGGSSFFEVDGFTIEISSNHIGPVVASNFSWTRAQQRKPVI